MAAANQSATILANLNTALTNISALIANITANPQPSYSVEGVSLSWGEYLATLVEQQKNIIDQIQILSGPFEYVTQGV